MTAEIGVMNKQGLVLAADSAVTIGGQKVHNTSNKVFTLGPSHFIGLMIYGNAEFMNIPWSIIIHKFNRELGESRLDYVKDYEASFLDCVREDENLQGRAITLLVVQEYTYNICQKLFNDVNSKLSSEENSATRTIAEILPELVDSIIGQALSSVEKTPKLTIGYKFEEFFKNYGEKIKSLITEFGNQKQLIPEFMAALLNNVDAKLSKLIFYFIVCGIDIGISSGVVIAGFGKKEMFSEIRSLKLFCNIDGHLVYKVDQQAKVGSLNTETTAIAHILPFAQGDVVATLINGLAPQLSQSLTNIMIGEQIDPGKISNVFNSLSSVQNNEFIGPMINSVSSLTISELAEVAETLVNVTSFKRKYTSDLATVGGPIDILAITYDEGPVWIKQKHYFNLDDNINFRIRREKHGNE